MAKILLLDDEKIIRRAIELQLKKSGHEVFSCKNGQEGLDAIEKQKFDLIISDLQMPKVSGIELLKRLNENHLQIPVIILTGFASVESAVEAMKLGASDYITKPPQLDEITLKVEKTLSQQELAEENRRLKNELKEKFQFEGIIGRSPKMLAMFERLKPLSNDRHISILLIGESGTGKELMAKAIHYNSPRKNDPFVAINCGALPEHLLESELFGHEKGAFTDAKETKKGLFETANNGSLFLDEIGSMPVEMQVKLLRAIEEKEIRRVGGTKEIPLDVRFIAASNQDLEKLVAKGEFRQDLYYRLAVAPVNLPPLRERIGDVGLLVNHFLEKFNKEKGKSIEIDFDAVKSLEKQTWKGNVRELENFIELQVVISQDGNIELTNIAENVLSGKDNNLTSNDSGQDLKTATKLIVENFERDFIRQKLIKNRWNISQTAENIGVSRGALHSKMKKYELNR